MSGRSCCLALPTIHQHSKPNQTAVTEPAGHMLLLNPRPASPVGGRPCTCLHRRAAGTLSSCWPLGRVTWALFPLASVLSVLWNCHRRLLLFAEHTQQRFRQFASRLSQNYSACQMGRYNHVAVHLFALSPHAFFPPPTTTRPHGALRTPAGREAVGKEACKLCWLDPMGTGAVGVSAALVLFLTSH